MRTFDVDHEPFAQLQQEAVLCLEQERHSIAHLLARIGAVDALQHYLAAGYGSASAWCKDVLGVSSDVAERRVRQARLARRFPRIFAMLEDGRLDISHLNVLAPQLTAENSAELLAAAAHKTRFEIEVLLAGQAPKLDLPAQSAPLESRVQHDETKPAALRVEELSGPRPIVPRPRIEPLSPQRYAWQLTATQQMQDDLQRAKELLGHAVPSGDMTQILARALRVLVQQEERRKCAATDRPRRARTSKNPRHIPAHIRRHVWQRDGGRCTFLGESGHRCEERSRLEFDHIEPVARGGQTTVANLRLRCRAHNQFAAERSFGRGFMDAKRRSSQAVIDTEEAALHRDVISSLRNLGCSIDEARRIAERPEVRCARSLDARILRAVQQLGPPSARRIAPA
ncbi:MAG TPA: HNH endonuclease signature motif containing protein [Candidatus Acidoferrales bacterium]|nr:HNH endonuclease signature motif containing protein [Candidatus Acidoferrales bacterium]